MHAREVCLGACKVVFEGCGWVDGKRVAHLYHSARVVNVHARRASGVVAGCIEDVGGDVVPELIVFLGGVDAEGVESGIFECRSDGAGGLRRGLGLLLHDRNALDEVRHIGEREHHQRCRERDAPCAFGVG